MSGRNGAAGRVSPLDGAAPESTDFANYFCTYGYIYHQKDMVEDHKRTGAYYNACAQNRAQFAGRTVLDVGTGSGILAIFAARAGARKVYAVEATDMAKRARALVAANGLAGVVEVIQGTVESVELPEKVDVIISEWMGYFLLRESMLDSVLVARDRWLAPGGAMYPSHARLLLAPARAPAAAARAAELGAALDGWADFVADVKRYYGVDMGCLSDEYAAEQREYYTGTSAWADVHPSALLGPAVAFKAYDLLTLSLEELRAPLAARLELPLCEAGPVEALVGFFDVAFRGSPDSPADFPVTLSTAPDPTGATHWGQQAFYLTPEVPAEAGDRLALEVRLARRDDNARLLALQVRHRLVGDSAAARAAEAREARFNID